MVEQRGGGPLQHSGATSVSHVSPSPDQEPGAHPMRAVRRKGASVVIIHNTGGEACVEQAAEEEILLTLTAVSDALEGMGRAVRIMTLEPPLSETARLLEGIPGDAVVFNLFEGFPGDPPSEVQVGLLLESLRLRATGCPPLSMHMGLNKDLCKEVLSSRGLPPSPGVALRSKADLGRPLHFPFPVFMKPVADDASHGIGPENLVREAGAYSLKAGDLLDRFPSGILVEPFLSGREFNCGVIESMEDGPLAFPPSLVDYSALPEEHPPVLTFAAKWQPGTPVFDLTPTICPAPVEASTVERVRTLSREAFHALRCRGYARIDLREDGKGNLHILEVNPNPDISPTAGLAKQARALGWDYADLVCTVLDAAERGPRWIP